MTASRLMLALLRLPPDHYTQIGMENYNDDSGDSRQPLPTACVFQRAPEMGWESRGARFGHPPGSPSHDVPAKPHEHDDRVIFGVNAENATTLERLLIDALTDRWP